jgi:hypothetical protein
MSILTLTGILAFIGLFVLMQFAYKLGRQVEYTATAFNYKKKTIGAFLKHKFRLSKQK